MDARARRAVPPAAGRPRRLTRIVERSSEVPARDRAADRAERRPRRRRTHRRRRRRPEPRAGSCRRRRVRSASPERRRRATAGRGPRPPPARGRSAGRATAAQSRAARPRARTGSAAGRRAVGEVRLTVRRPWRTSSSAAPEGTTFPPLTICAPPALSSGRRVVLRLKPGPPRRCQPRADLATSSWLSRRPGEAGK